MTLSTQQRITDAQWRKIEATLPATADHVSVRKTLERIAREKLGPVKLAAEYENCARIFDRAISSLLFMELNEDQEAGLTGQLAQLRERAREWAKAYRRLGKVKRPRFARHCEILWLWESSGGGWPQYPSTPRGNAPPYGPVFPFFQAAAEAIFGKTPSAWQIKDIVIEFRHLNFSAAQFGGVMGGHIDDSKVFIIPAAEKI